VADLQLHSKNSYSRIYAAVAQLDRASDFESEACERSKRRSKARFDATLVREEAIADSELWRFVGDKPT
jgi:hypothetical protein